ncbi:MAG: hypothetical protein PHV54_01550 [Tolumonas sp.]|nr:hypothetical protein [Tolumonas sp.]
MSHVPEPWHECDNGSCGCGQILGPECVYVATVKDRASRARIVTCVNACAGMENPAEEIAVLKKQQNVINAWGSEFNELAAERDEYHNAVIGMSAMIKNHEWANLLSTNDALADLDVQITNLHGELSREKQDSLDCDDIKKLKLALSWMGCSTPESLEECGARQKNLVRDLIRAVLRRKKLKKEGGAE